ncbi:MAG TPA: hypothetical protein GX702_14490 [Chloroflexi bacterium]|nr:hypothetical protein [Chloroflexota bacterium]
MSRYNAPEDFMGGVYVIRFETADEAGDFLAQYSACPVWPVMTRGLRPNEVVVLALEPVAQHHCDFSQENNSLVLNPDYLGAEAVMFRRDDGLLDLFPRHSLETGYADEPPCGSDCGRCPSFREPCRGCPACYRYEE